MSRLSCSASQPHLSMAARRLEPHAPSLQPTASEPDLAYFSGPSQLRHPAPGRQLGRSASAATIGSIAEDEPYTYDAAMAYCGSGDGGGGGLNFGARASSASSRPPRGKSTWGTAAARPGSSGGGGRRAANLAAFESRPAAPPAYTSTSSTVNSLISHYAGGKLAPPAWVLRAMRALEDSYEKKLREARETVLKVPEVRAASVQPSSCLARTRR